MKLSERFEKGRFIHKKAKLLIDLELDNGESMKKGDIGNVLIDYGNGEYRFEHGQFACRVNKNEIVFI